MKRLIILLFIVFATVLFSQEMLDEVKVSDVRERLEQKGTLKDVIIKTEVVTKEQLEKKQATNLSEAVDNEVGIQAAAGCSMCGMKRIRVNGMKGEHTTVLVDDIPMHSTVSSYYGMDAYATSGLSRIEIARGAGASLIAPGAIGGVINIISERASKNSAFIDYSMGNNDYRKLALLSSIISKDKKTRTSLFGQYNNEGQWDEDDNGVNEAPSMENYSVGLRLSHDLSDYDNLDITARFFTSDVFGGPIYDNHHMALQGNNNPDEAFVGGDINNDFIGNPLSTLEAITTNRGEVTAKWIHSIDDESNFQVSSSFSNQTQDSVYEGADYYSDDLTLFNDVRYNNSLTDSHFITAGIDFRIENMKAKSHAFFNSIEDGGLGLDKDDFEYFSAGLYLQDIWSITDALELSSAVRLDKIDVDWTSKDGTEIEEFLASPRLHLRWDHTPELVSRISMGTGYRAPLTFFESEHGVLEEGFEIYVDDIEKSISAGYALSYDNDRFTSTASFNYNKISNLAIISDDVPEGTNAGFILTNDTNDYQIITADIVAGYQLTPALNISGSYERMIYEDEYKAVQFLAQIEDRAKLNLEFETRDWLFNVDGTYIGERDLTEYGYGDTYNVFNDANDNGQADPGELSDPKDTDVSAYMTLNMKLSKTIGKYTLYAGAKNLLDYTQTGEEESPLFWDADGGYDVGHIWGPLKGRQLYGGVQVKF